MGKTNVDTSIEFARQLDKEDELSVYQHEFYRQSDTIYMDGNSLGLLSRRAENSLFYMLDSWKTQGIDGWTNGKHPWFYLSEKLGEQSTYLVGAKKEEVIITGSTTINLHQLLATFYKPNGKRTKILADELNFPSDIYAIKSHLKLRGFNPEEHLILVKSRDGHTLVEEDIIDSMTDEVALAVFPSVIYRSGQLLDMKRITEKAHQFGILVGFDLCHSIGAIPHSLDKWDVDFAFWCTYKYVNGGPGSPAGIYVNEKHLPKAPGLGGWFGSDKTKQFDMDLTMNPSETAGALQIGTPHVLSAAPLLGSLEMFQEIGIGKIRSKSLKLTEYMMALIDKTLIEYGFTIANPKEDYRRGGHIYLEHPEAARICKTLKQENIIPDFRPPSGIRLAPAALYNTFEDVWHVVQVLNKIMKEESYKKFENKREVVS
ncbi:kynureninase [Oceanobacillus sp. Castelsardo]|uniref:kynureninase n=1 Tax=Oceanobacillus sp. Castelsardo TaxID=1851204 RepID=UPI0008392BF3|nr:kynureninase [Oceanobacillus sp. Castelsardo]